MIAGSADGHFGDRDAPWLVDHMDDRVGDMVRREAGVVDRIGAEAFRRERAGAQLADHVDEIRHVVRHNADPGGGVDHGAGQTGGGNAGGFDCGDLDLAAAFDAQRFRKEVHGGFGSAIDRRTDHREVAIDRGQVDDLAAASRDHRIVGRDHAIEHALDIDIDAALPRRVGGFVIGEEREWHDTCVVDHHVDPAVHFDGAGDERLDRCEIAHIGLESDGRSARAGDGIGCRLRGGLPVST